jgi:choline monooxygenase
VQVETWRGFVFVNLHPGGAPLAEILRPLDERLGAQIRRPARVRDRHPVVCNWKVFVENYLDGYHDEGVRPSLATDAAARRDEVDLLGDIAFYQAPAHQNAAESLWAWVWPNLGVSLYRGVLMLESFRPEGPDRTVIDHVFMYEPEDPGVDAAILNAERITEEDAWVSERVQQNLDAGIYKGGVLSPTREAAVVQFQVRVNRALAG